MLENSIMQNLIVNGTLSPFSPFSHISFRLPTSYSNATNTSSFIPGLSTTVASSQATPTRKVTVTIIIALCLYTIVFLTGVTGNSLVLMTLARVKTMQSVKNFFIGNLALADLLILLVCLPLTVIGFFIPWPYGEFACKYVFPLTDVICSVSIITLVAISLDRFRAIVYPFARKLTLKRTLVTLGIIWILSYLVAGLPLSFALKLKEGHWVEKSCDLSWPSREYETVFRVCIFTFLYAIPVVLIFICFITILKKLRDNIRFTRLSVRGRNNLAKVSKRQRISVMMFLIFISFAFCMLPIQILFLLLTFHPRVTNWMHLGIYFQISMVFFFTNSSLNPIILAFISQDFRRGFKMNFYCIFCCFKLFAKRPGRGTKMTVKENSTSQEDEVETNVSFAAADIFKPIRKLSFRMKRRSRGTLLTKEELQDQNENEEIQLNSMTSNGNSNLN